MTRCRKFLMAVASLLVISGGVVRAAPGDSNEHRAQLLENAYQDPVAVSPRAGKMRLVPTNTLAFKEYALGFMLTQANHLNKIWGLGLPSPMTTDHITRLAATPMIGGIAGGITVSNQVQMQFNDGRFIQLRDTRYCWWGGIESDSSKQLELSRQRSLLTEREARRIAEEALRRLGIVPRQFDLMDTPVVEQYRYYVKDDKRLPLPLFLVRWVPSPDAQFDDIRIEVSGLTRRVVAYENWLATAMPLPTNYFQMLGVSSDSSRWGVQFGYDPRHTPAFDQFARKSAVAEANRLIQSWQLDFPRPLTTSDIVWFLAEPRTNAPSISAAFTNRFYVQMVEGFVGLFEDKAHSRSSFAKDESQLRSPKVMTNVLDKMTAIQLARDALRLAGLDEIKLRLREPPVVTQVTFPDAAGDETVKLPLYDVFWSFPPEEQPKYGEMSAVGVQVSAVTRKVAMFANNCPWAPKLALPTNYFQLLGAPHEAGPRRRR